MDREERLLRSGALREAIHGHQAADWLKQQLKDLAISQHMKQIAATPA
jgi:hypothetical protein